MKLPDPENTLSFILADLTARLERIEAKLGILLEREVPFDQLKAHGYFGPDPKRQRHKQPWE